MARFGVFGAVEVREHDGVIVPLTSVKQRLLLAMLVVEANRVVAADRLVEELWSDELPHDPAAALRNQVARLRRALGSAGDHVVTEDRGYRLSVDASAVDVRRFEALVAQAAGGAAEPALELLDEALALRRGPALAEFADRPFAQAEALRLEELHSGARERHAELLIQLGEVDAAVADLQALVADHPHRERAHALLMEALYRAGRHVDALATYQSWRKRLMDDHGLEPSPEFKTLEREILENRPRPGEGTAPVAGGSSLPASSTRLLGRDADVAAVVDLLEGARLVTLTGPGGVGKTRLALEVAHLLESEYRRGVRFCDLSAIRRPASVVRAVASALGVEDRAFHRLEDDLVDYLAAEALLLVLDNCEHVIDAVSTLAGRVLRDTRRCRLLATSRERLSVDGEHVWQVPPLPTGGPSAAAVRLFRERARAIDPMLRDEDLDAVAVEDLCAKLDGLPLAIELAAARLPGMTVAELTRALASPTQALATGRRSAHRHHSLEAVVDWSFRLLEPVDQRVFRSLSVFTGWFDADAAAVVAGGSAGGSARTSPDLSPAGVAGALLRLVDRSLVVAERDGATTRYRLLDTLRRYGVAQLESLGQIDSARERHAQWALHLAESAARQLGGPSQGRWVRTLDRYFGELRVAHGWLVGHDPERSLRLVAELHWYTLWGLHSEVFRWAEIAAAGAGGSGLPLLGAALSSAAFGAAFRGDLEGAERFAISAAAAAADPAADPVSRHRSVEARGEVALLRGQLDQAVDFYRSAYELAVSAGELMAAAWDAASVGLSLAWDGHTDEAAHSAALASQAAAGSGNPSAEAFVRYARAEILIASDPDQAERLLNEALALAEPAGARLVASVAQVTLATLYSRHHHDPKTALVYYRDAIDEWHRAGLWTSQWVTLRTLVELLARVGRLRDAATLYGAVMTATTGAPAYGADRERLSSAGAELRAQLGDAGFDEAVAEGERLEADAAVALAQNIVRRALSDREFTA